MSNSDPAYVFANYSAFQTLNFCPVLQSVSYVQKLPRNQEYQLHCRYLIELDAGCNTLIRFVILNYTVGLVGLFVVVVVVYLFQCC